uniref:Uncharacterized protein n=1 Tax=Megaselia scalaris TaxID=36166 RepID=T1GYY8_MEGSC
MISFPTLDLKSPITMLYISQRLCASVLILTVSFPSDPLQRRDVYPVSLENVLQVSFSYSRFSYSLSHYS